MLNLSIPKRQIYSKGLSLGITTSITISFINMFHRNIENNGIEWTCDRLKSIKQDLIHYYSDRTIPATPWVARNSKTKLFKGTYGSLFQYSLQSTKCFKRVLTLLNIYTAFLFDEPRETVEKKKFLSAVTTPGKSVPNKYTMLGFQAGYRWRTSKDVHPAGRFELEPYTTPSREERYMREPIAFFSTEEGIHTIQEYYDVFGDSMNGIWGFRGPRYTGEEPYIGSIHCTPNPGLKARFFASPALWIQHVLTPLGRIIYSKVNDLPWDCTFDQSKPDLSVKDRLTRSKTTFCFDLSSATDRFPFDLQITVLKAIFTSPTAQRHIQFYEYIQSFPYNFYGEPLRWVRGQALGMYPSFGTFTLTHGMMLYALNNFSHNNKFFVLGDDVIILDPELAQSYEQFLIDCDIPYAPHKTISSNRIAEFAGHIYTGDSKFRVPKWKPLNRRNILEQISEWGLSLIHLLPKDYWEVTTRVASLPSPWGCDLNPQGLSLDDRFQGYEDLLTKESMKMEYSTNIRSYVLNRMIHTSDLKCLVNLQGSLNLVDNADQALTNYLHKKGINLPIPNEIAGKNLYEIDPELDIPLKGLVEGKISQQSWATRLSRFFKKKGE